MSSYYYLEKEKSQLMPCLLAGMAFGFITQVYANRLRLMTVMQDPYKHAITTTIGGVFGYFYYKGRNEMVDYINVSKARLIERNVEREEAIRKYRELHLSQLEQEENNTH